MIFFIVFIVAIIYSISENFRFQFTNTVELKNRNVYFGAKILCLIMFLLCALRSVDVGIDTAHYFDSFNLGASRFVEFGYWFFRGVSLYFDNSFQFFLALYAFASIVPIYIFLKRDSVNICFSLLIYLSFSNYFYPETFNTIRATASIGSFVLAVSFYESKNYQKTILFLILSVLFHNSVIVALIIGVLCNIIKKLPEKGTYISLIISLVFGLTFQTGYSSYASMLSLWVEEFTGDMADYYSQYVISFEETDFNIIGTLANMLPFTLFAIFTYDKHNAKHNYYKMFVIGTILSNVFISIALIYRITMFFTILLIVILPNTIIRSNGTKRRILFSLIALMLLWFIYKLFGTSSDRMAGIIPYSFFFE